MILRKDAGAGRAGAASLPTRRNLSAAPGAGEEGPGSERYGERADLHGASGDAQGELCSPPLHSRRGKSTDEAEKGRTQARSMWSERRYRATRRAVFSHMRDSRRVALCEVSHRRKVESGVTSQRGELSSPICGTAAARNCRDGAYRLMEGRFRGTRQRAIRRRRLHRLSHFDQLRPPTMWSERRYPLMIERSKGRIVCGITQEKASMTRNRSPQMLSTCSSALCTSSGPRLSAASAWASVSA